MSANISFLAENRLSPLEHTWDDEGRWDDRKMEDKKMEAMKAPHDREFTDCCGARDDGAAAIFPR